MSKYEPLTKYLKSLNYSHIPMTFEEIERVIGAQLPPSAFKHRPWWSNNPSNSVITYAWLRAGYKTASVDMGGRRLVFEKIRTPHKSPGDFESHKAPQNAGMADRGHQYSHSTEAKSEILRIFGCMKGTIKIMPGIDVTKPALSDQELNEIDEDAAMAWRNTMSKNSSVDQAE